MAAMAAAAAAEQLLWPMQGARGGGAQERVQHVLLGLHRRTDLLTLPQLSQGSPPYPGQNSSEFVPPIIQFLARIDQFNDYLQIRRSSYHDVIRVGEIQKYLDIAGVQTYIINSAKIVFLNQRRRPQPRPGKGSATNTCCVCDRSLLDSFDFCSIGCKIVGTSKNFDKEKMRTDDGGASDSDESFESVNAASIRKQVVRIKVQGFTPSTPPQTAASKRRKGVPRRAPTGGLLLGY
ncbi:hypothetical protein SASPL_110859 [Salvia splendens]|uniref:Uncharacterized protein n=1 Tax=Salvia splendens TaxID=180675 RepID=A0A8X9A1V5_SALSN|nr:hypothetical protein SASPL_110859 [Salvia splendens]